MGFIWTPELYMAPPMGIFKSMIQNLTRSLWINPTCVLIMISRHDSLELHLPKLLNLSEIHSLGIFFRKDLNFLFFLSHILMCYSFGCAHFVHGAMFMNVFVWFNNDEIIASY